MWARRAVRPSPPTCPGSTPPETCSGAPPRWWRESPMPPPSPRRSSATPTRPLSRRRPSLPGRAASPRRASSARAPSGRATAASAATRSVRSAPTCVPTGRTWSSPCPTGGGRSSTWTGCATSAATAPSSAPTTAPPTRRSSPCSTTGRALTRARTTRASCLWGTARCWSAWTARWRRSTWTRPTTSPPRSTSLSTPSSPSTAT